MPAPDKHTLQQTANDLCQYLRLCCAGREQAHTVRFLSRELQAPERLVRAAGALLARTTGRVGSSTSSPAGLWWIENGEEAQEAEQQLMTRIEDLSKRAKALRNAWPQLGQLRLTA